MPSPMPAGQPLCFRPIFLLALALAGLLLIGIPPAPLADEPPPLAADLVVDGQAIDLTQEKYRQLFDELTHKYQFSADTLLSIFQGLTINRKILVLMDKQGEAKPYYSYAPTFITPDNIRTGKEKLQQYKSLLDRIETTFKVNREVIVAIWGVETRYGIRRGNYDLLQTLNTLFAAYPRRSDFYRKQLIDFLLLCREEGLDPHGIKGSAAGAFGQMQFIPSSFRSYAVSFDGDTKRDVWNSVPDVLASIANYLKQANWVFNTPLYADLGYQLNDPQLIAAVDKGRAERRPLNLLRQSQGLELPPSPQDRAVTIISLDLEPGGLYTKRYVAGYPNFQAITAWNRSNRYAMVICELAEALAADSP